MSAARWVPAVVVAAGAAVATAHGLYEVAHASRVPAGVAVLYPLVTDGLALVAYAATRRLTGAGARYAWAVVVLSAALSGVAQAVYLAADSVAAAPLLRAGVGAWPAVACALVAHLLHLIVVAEREPTTGQPLVVAADADPVETAPAAALPASEPAASSSHAASEQVASEPEPVHEPVGESSPDVDPRVVAIARRLAAGEELTGPAIAVELDVSPRTGRRLLGDARAHRDQHAPLHLVTRKETTA